MKLLKRFDAGLARGEAALAVVFLLAMIAFGTLQALMRNISTIGDGVQWANAALGMLSWVDEFMQKGTLWLAFLGASLATRDERHISIDVLPRIASRKVRLLTKGLASVGAAAVSFVLARAFWIALKQVGLETPPHLEVYEGMNTVHVCDASAASIATMVPRPDVPHTFCALRDALGLLDMPVATWWSALQLIVPVMFVVIAVRLIGHGLGAFREVNKPEPPTPAPAKEG